VQLLRRGSLYDDGIEFSARPPARSERPSEPVAV
jgi:hypothetical protein